MIPTLLALTTVAPPQSDATVDLAAWRELVSLACVDCHGAARSEAGLDLEAALASPTEQRSTWERAYHQVQARSMPPEGGLDAEERAEWIAGAALAVGSGGGQRATARRLTRSQLGRVLQDLLAVEVPVERYLARDASAEGFDTTGDVLFVTPLSFETLFELVDVALEQARAAGEAPVFDTTVAAEERLARFVERAFRRPPTAGELSTRKALMAQMQGQGASDEVALDAALRATLLAPAFLYRNELSSPGDAFDRAARLALFLWGRLPDEGLLERAREGALDDPASIDSAVEIMLDDERARWLAEDFALQWLGVSELADVTPDVRRFKEFNEGLRQAMRAEVVAFFFDLVAEDRSLLECLDSDRIHVNARLARHYGIEGIEGAHVRPVPRAGAPERGGVLAMAAVHTITSEPLRTSPVKRGQWLLERLLRSPAPPPPPDAGVLPEDDVQEDGLSLRERLELHRRDPTCASCHARMDPYGFALEAFDGIGKLRPEVDASAVLPGGEAIAGPIELKAALLRDGRRFVRAFVDHLFVYAVGRPPGLADHEHLEQILDRSAGQGYPVRQLILGIASTPAFRGTREP